MKLHIGRILDWLLRRPKYIELPHVLFLARCSDGDLAVKIGRPDVFVSDLRRMAGCLI